MGHPKVRFHLPCLVSLELAARATTTRQKLRSFKFTMIGFNLCFVNGNKRLNNWTRVREISLK